MRFPANATRGLLPCSPLVAGPHRWLSGSFPLIRFESLLIALLLLAATLLAPSSAGAVVPSGFTDAFIVSVSSPTDVAFHPDGRMVIASQSGVLRIRSSNGALSTILNLSGKVCSDFERGLLGVTFDPSFASNHYIYVFYTFNKHGTCARNVSTAPVNRVSRFVMNGSTVDAGSEVVLVDNMPSPNGNHNAGDLLFGKDGHLYITIGDGGCDLSNPSLCAGQNANARLRNVLTGKVLRITRDGGIPSGNPFTGSSSGRCNVNGRTTATHCQETYAWGLRNPFRMALDPNASGTKIYVNDVGQNAWEEIDNLIAGADYGWNVREGNCANGSTSNCGSPPAGMTNPVYAYGHGGGCASITGGAFVPNNTWPSTYSGAYLFADYVCGKIFMLKAGSVTEFATGLGAITALEFGPFGPGKALYYASYNNGGEIRRISTNRAPEAVASADPTFGEPPLEVAFDGGGSSDPDGDGLTYRWDFDDGTPDATTVNPTHTFAQVKPGGEPYNVTLTVTDSKGASDSTTIPIQVGNTPPLPEIASPLPSHQFSVGETITLTGSATDPQEGPIADSSLSWSVRLHHATHEHPYFSGTGNRLTFQAPAPEDLPAATNSYLVISLTATDSTGLSATTTFDLQPKRVQIDLQSDPSSLQIQVEGKLFTTPAVITSWAGNALDLYAPDQLIASGEAVVWASWSVPGGQSFQYITPASDATLTAGYDLVTGPAFAPVADARVREKRPTTNEGKVTGLSARGGTTSDMESFLRFEVSGIQGQVVSAKLYVYTYDGTSDGPRIYNTSNNWVETSITWSNKPGTSGGNLHDLGAVPNRAWITLDVTEAITGNGIYSFLMRSTSTDAMSVYSREASSRQPRLVITTAGTGDLDPPTSPIGLTADARASDTVVLKWNPATDNIGVTGYDIFRNGVLLTSIGAATTYTDNAVAANTSYTYQVRSRDAASNLSATSGGVAVRTPAPTSTLVLTPVADARVWESSPATNYGRSSELRAEGGTDPDFESYLRFQVAGVSGGTYRATLRLFVPARAGYGTVDGPKLYRTGASWGETSITWNTKPARSGAAIADAGAIAEGAWVEYDVTSIVYGNGTFSFVLVSPSTDVVVFSSREGANPPQLVVTSIIGTAVTGAEAVDEPAPTATAAAGPPATPAGPVLPFADGFESGDLSGWTEWDGFAANQARASEGAWSGVARSSGSQASPGTSSWTTLRLTEPRSELFVRVDVLVEQRGSNPVDLTTLFDDRDRPILTLLVNDEGALTIRNDRTRRETAITEFTLREWHRVQLRLVVAGNNGQVEVWLDGALIARLEQRLGSRPVAAFSLGDRATDRTYTVFFDNVGADVACIGICPAGLVVPEPTVGPTQAPAPQAPAETPEPSATPVPTNTPTPSGTPEPTIEPPVTPTPPPLAEPTPEETRGEETPAEVNE